jgi:glyoxylase-like metal-dependent hydrolase (beta-lactamase superfamily II)
MFDKHGKRAARRLFGGRSFSAAAAFGCAAIWVSAAVAEEQTPYAKLNAAVAASEIKVTAVRGNVSLLEGAGGNIGVLTGPEGFFLVDTGIAVAKDKILSALKALGGGPVRYAVNTHWHWDHADGNAWARPAGATVISSRNTDRRLGQTIRVAEWQHTFTPNPSRIRPNMLLTAPRTIRLNGESVLIRPYVHGHTDGDLSVYFTRADVLQTGDTFWNGQYPFIDYVAGGSIDGAIRLADSNIAMAKPDTLVIPGHGPVGTRRELAEFRDMLVSVRGRVARLKARGMSLDEVLIARPTADLDPSWGKGIVDATTFTSLVYRGV